MLASVRDAVAHSGFADPISLRLDVQMAPKYHPTPLSGGDRKALAKELGKARAMANILATRSEEMRAKGKRSSSRQTSCYARVGMNACGQTENPLIRRPLSTKR